MNGYGVIEELGGFTRPGSNRIYKTKEQAEKAAKRYFYSRKTQRAIKKLMNMTITYSDIYNKVVSWQDTIEYDAPTTGGGFYQGWSDIWSHADYQNSSRTLGWLFSHMNDNDKPGLRSLVDAIYQEYSLSDPDLAYAITVLDNIDESYFNEV